MPLHCCGRQVDQSTPRIAGIGWVQFIPSLTVTQHAAAGVSLGIPVACQMFLINRNQKQIKQNQKQIKPKN